MKLNVAILVLALLMATAVRLHASAVTYSFTGVASLENFPGSGSNFGPIGSGTPVTGSFTIDLSAVGQPSGIPGFTDYSQQIPPANFSVTLGGLTIQAAPNVGGLNVLIGLGVAGIVDNFSLMVTGESLSGLDWSFSPDPSGPASTTSLSLKFPLNFLSDLAQLPTLSVDAFSKPSKVSMFVGAGTYSFPGGSMSIDPGNEGLINFGLASITLVPEPSSMVLAALALGGFLAWGWRRRNRGPYLTRTPSPASAGKPRWPVRSSSRRSWIGGDTHCR